MTVLEYYKADRAAATRVEMFDYVAYLLANDDIGEATKVFDDLRAIELKNEVADKDAIVLIPVDEKAAGSTQIRSVVNNPLSWEVYTVKNSKVQNKRPTAGAIETFRNLKVTHAELVSYFEKASRPQYHDLLLAHNPNWDVNWLFESGDIQKSYLMERYVRNTRKMGVVRHAMNLGMGRNGSIRDIGDGHNLDDETLELAMHQQFYTVAADPRISAEIISETWEEIKKEPQRDYHQRVIRQSFIKGASQNPHTPSWVLADFVEVHSYGTLLGHPNLDGDSLDRIAIWSGNDQDLRIKIASHPNVKTTTLKRLSKTTHPPLAVVVQQRLAERPKK